MSMNNILFDNIGCNDRDNSNLLPVAEDFYSIQGEGFNAGKPAYFLRLAGCNIACPYCDTKGAWNRLQYPLRKITDIVDKIAKSGAVRVVVTGGEPTMYNLDKLTAMVRDMNIELLLETSGVYPITGLWDWICVSPKKHKKPAVDNISIADELKVIVGEGNDFSWAEECRQYVNDKCKLYLQPEFSSFDTMIDAIVEYVKKNSVWNISLQLHKFINVP